jgi:hypothetical protein
MAAAHAGPKNGKRVAEYIAQHPSNSATPISDALHVLKPGWVSVLTPYMLKLCQAKERRQLSGKTAEERVHILYNSFRDSKKRATGADRHGSAA